MSYHTLIVSEKEEGETLLFFLRLHLGAISSVKGIKRAIDQKKCTIDGRVEFFSTYKVRSGQKIVIELFTKKLTYPLEMLYEEEGFILYNKPPHMASEDFVDLLLVHRLDKETSGVILLAKTEEMQKKLADLFREREVEKEYLAICDGRVEKAEWIVDNRLGIKASYEGGVLYGRVPTGKRAITHFQLLKAGKTESIVLAKPTTGRTHQIRVHLKGSGHPVLGDWQYNSKFQSPLRPERLQLHAQKLVFVSPKTGKKLAVKAPLFQDMKKVMDTVE